MKPNTSVTICLCQGVPVLSPSQITPGSRANDQLLMLCSHGHHRLNTSNSRDVAHPARTTLSLSVFTKTDRSSGENSKESYSMLLPIAMLHHLLGLKPITGSQESSCFSEHDLQHYTTVV